MSNLQQSSRRPGIARRVTRSATLGVALIGSLAACSGAGAPAASAAPTAAPQEAATVQVKLIQPTPSTAPTTAAAPTTQAPTAVPTEPPPEPAATEALPTEAPAVSSGLFKDGEYTTESVRVDRWGQLQLKITIEGGQLTKIDVLEYPHSTRRSDVISRAALPTLIKEAVQKQDAKVDMVTRATDTCVAFIEALEPVLDSAKA